MENYVKREPCEYLREIFNEYDDKKPACYACARPVNGDSNLHVILGGLEATLKRCANCQDYKPEKT